LLALFDFQKWLFRHSSPPVQAAFLALGVFPPPAPGEETLKSVTPETMSMKEVGSPAWDPLCQASAEICCSSRS